MRSAFPALVLVASLACSDAVSPEAAGIGVFFEVVAGDEQTGAVGLELPAPLVVRAVDDKGKSIKAQLVSFRVVAGGGEMFAGTAATNDEGIAQDYWMLGPDPGVNTVEVRSVDATTGEKHVFASFTAWGVVPGPELCNGLDDDLDGTPDDGLQYCGPGGIPAPNTDGVQCLAGYIDLNADPADGCEALAEGTWSLNPAVILNCGFVPLGFGDIRVQQIRSVAVSPSLMRITPRLEIGILPPFEAGSIDVPVDPASSTFGGSGSFSFSGGSTTSFSYHGQGSISLDGAFTGPGSLRATLGMTLGISVAEFGITLFGGQCDGLSMTLDAWLQ